MGIARVVNDQRFIFRKNFRSEEECRLRNRTSPRMLPRPRTMLTTTLAGRGPAPPAKSQKPKGGQSLAPDPGNDRNRRNAHRRNAEKDVRLAHAAVPRAVQAGPFQEPFRKRTCVPLTQPFQEPRRKKSLQGPIYDQSQGPRRPRSSSQGSQRQEPRPSFVQKVKQCVFLQCNDQYIRHFSRVSVFATEMIME